MCKITSLLVLDCLPLAAPHLSEHILIEEIKINIILHLNKIMIKISIKGDFKASLLHSYPWHKKMP